MSLIVRLLPFACFCICCRWSCWCSFCCCCCCCSALHFEWRMHLARTQRKESVVCDECKQIVIYKIAIYQITQTQSKQSIEETSSEEEKGRRRQEKSRCDMRTSPLNNNKAKQQITDGCVQWTVTLGVRECQSGRQTVGAVCVCVCVFQLSPTIDQLLPCLSIYLTAFGRSHFG